jgi:ribonuclease III
MINMVNKDLSPLEEKIGLTFRHRALLELALTHSSYVNENPRSERTANERLELLGDAVLGLVIAEKLYHELPDADEGELTRLRSALVRREMLAQIAGRIDLGDFLYLGAGEEPGGGREKPANLAGAFEALIAAVYLDQGLEIARALLLKLFKPAAFRQAPRQALNDHKSELQEVLQATEQVTPTYHLVEATGPDHAREFTIEVKAGERVIGRGRGKSKKTAAMEAARTALKNLSEQR